MRGFYRIITIGVLGLLACLPVSAQDDNDIQSWNDLQITVPITKTIDFSGSITGRFGKSITRLNDGRLSAGLVFKIGKSWTINPFYWYISARNTAGAFRVENRLNLRIGYKFPFKKFGLSHRSWFERRFRASGNTWRYRPSLTFEKALPKKFIADAKFYITEEPFYDSATKKFSRNRFTVGINKTLTKRLAVDIYYMRQNDGFSDPGDLNVIGTSWKLKL
jgi:hypothetical protein